jgi:long-chain fatty acid transport protein
MVAETWSPVRAAGPVMAIKGQGMSSRLKVALFSATALSAVVLGAADVRAGGFAIREQSAYGQGTSFAGIAAGGSLSAMFWNPATLTQNPGFSTESSMSLLWPYADHNASAGSQLLALGSAGNSGEFAFVPASYISYQILPNAWVGISVNAPFGLSTHFPSLWAGRNYAESSNAKTYNFAPSIAVKINDWLSVGAGVQIQYFRTDLRQGIGAGLPGGAFVRADLSGNGWGYGFTAGVTITPTSTTEIGIGYRSRIDQEIEGDLNIVADAPNAASAATAAAIAAGAGTTVGGISSTVKLPDTVTASIRQKFSESFTGMATVEWSNWSRIGTSTVQQASGATATIAGNAVTLPFEFDDGWFFAVGGEYILSPKWTVRAGVAYEISPISDAVRIPLLPDNDRVWLSAGLSYTLLPNVVVDLAYTHIFVKETDINIGPGHPWFAGRNVTYVGTSSPHVDILSLGLKVKFAPAPKPVVTKG